MDKIIIRGARQHNLKDINLELPKNKLIVFTGLSGSGKTSLAFDTIYAEGQRRYVESLSSYARQFLGVMDKPDVDLIEGLSPAISISQKSSSHNPRSTVGTVTENYDYLRLLFARIGHPHCPSCNREISRQSIEQISENVINLITSSDASSKLVKFLVLSPVVRDRKGEFNQLFESLRKKGFIRARVDGQLFSLTDDLVLIKTNKHSIDVVVDRLSLERRQLKSEIALANLKGRLVESIETALNLSDGLVIVAMVRDAAFTFPEKPKQVEDFLFSQNFACPLCRISLPEIEPRSFSFNSPHGACPECNGIGTLLKIDPESIINPRLSISEGGILPFNRIGENSTWWGKILSRIAEEDGFSLRTSIEEMKKKDLEKVLYGTSDRIIRVNGYNRKGQLFDFETTFEGVVPNLERRFKETQSDYIRQEIGKFMKKEVCRLCQGNRLKKEALSVTINGNSIAQIASLQIKHLLEWLREIQTSSVILSNKEKTIAEPILKDLLTRVSFLQSVGLDYLTIDRPAESLAGGETQRIRLASQIGTGLTGVLYVLDEPTIGLHQRDNQRLIGTLKKLRDLGNTVIVVEHDREMMENADWLVDFGPRAGDQGGQIVAAGTVSSILSSVKSLTGKYLSGKEEITVLTSVNKKNRGSLVIKGCSQYNLKNIDVTFPLGQFICVTGVSGSGKSTLVNETLYRAVASHFSSTFRDKPGTYRSLEGLDQIDNVRLIDQSPIGRTPRSNPATYTGIFTHIRELFAQSPEARIRGFKPGRFSFNVPSGRCDACQGAGEIKIEMQFLADVYVTCDVCKGQRYKQETLEVEYKGKNIAEVLQMSIEEASFFLRNIPGLILKLRTLSDVGLGYIKLGQPAPSLSGGEAQRIKLSRHLGKKTSGSSLYVLDEPTTGLHFDDLKKLLEILRRLVDAGNTIIVIEHNLDVIKNADWIIDLGPEGGDDGGYLVAQGTPRIVANCEKSYTGRFLRKILK